MDFKDVKPPEVEQSRGAWFRWRPHRDASVFRRLSVAITLFKRGDVDLDSAGDLDARLRVEMGRKEILIEMPRHRLCPRAMEAVPVPLFAERWMEMVKQRQDEQPRLKGSTPPFYCITESRVRRYGLSPFQEHEKQDEGDEDAMPKPTYVMDVLGISREHVHPAPSRRG
jgi:hypothetical protein